MTAYVRLFLLGFVFCLISCTDAPPATKPEEGGIVKEIQQRLNDLAFHTDSLAKLGIEPGLIHKKFEDILLVSKDSENKQAAVNMSKEYLDVLCEKHGFNPSQFQHLHAGMSMADMSLALKQNELHILNQIFLEKLKGHIELKTVK